MSYQNFSNNQLISIQKPITGFSLEKQVEEFVNELASETDELTRSIAFKQYLDIVSNFWNYSFRNQLLILSQNNSATLVAGFRTWNKLGRKINSGSKAIKILAPYLKKIIVKEHNGVEKQDEIISFFPVNVFDVSQTNGKPITKLDINIEGDNYESTFKKLLEFCNSKNIQVEFKPLGINGVYGYSTGGKIVLNNNQNTNMNVNTLIHEIAHETIHQNSEGKKFTKQEREIQAESTAYVVCKSIGLQTKSPTYLAAQKATAEQIKSNLRIISETSKEILEKIDSSTYLQKHEIIEFKET